MVPTKIRKGHGGKPVDEATVMLVAEDEQSSARVVRQRLAAWSLGIFFRIVGVSYRLVKA
ncbi:MAG: hypothetical protein QXY83_06165 [Thermosphaera sp.]